MKTILFRKFGPPEVLKIVNHPTPDPKDNEILVKIHAAGINPLDWKMRRGDMWYFVWKRPPIIPGSDIAGVVVKAGKKITKFKSGDRIVASLGHRFGGYAEFASLPENLAVRLPRKIDYVRAAAIPASGLTALNGLKLGRIKKGETVLVNGASGGVGIYAVQLAKYFGSTVTAVTGPYNLEFAKKIGADVTLNYTQDNIYDQHRKFNLIFDTVGNIDLIKSAHILKSPGYIITTLPTPKNIIISLYFSLVHQQFYKLILIKPNATDLDYIVNLVAQESIIPVIEKVYPMDQVRQAHARMETHHVRGKLVLKIIE